MYAALISMEEGQNKKVVKDHPYAYQENVFKHDPTLIVDRRRLEIKWHRYVFPHITTPHSGKMAIQETDLNQTLAVKRLYPKV